MSTDHDPETDGARSPAARPTLRVISGDATPEEIAAILAIVAARSGGSAPLSGADDDRAATWSEHGRAHRHIRAAFTPSRHGWKTSYWPS
ncbi:acyl-CoA carboxylase epsilon subunit [Kineosporia sp. A_224]|uniref:acyl-CoA carboxylase epsilon subunit n=1 Tax=Kineosporia sp. A_224 TaxID=1962180 RepID=UPI000B4A8129|nr:acyl-CoA carboxylase epsilon subunit [Kineosporia sp. A_224]